jgi:hypothetical protein
LIAEEIGVDGDRVNVYADPAFEWHAIVIAVPGQVGDLQRRADLATSELRTLYELKADE